MKPPERQAARSRESAPEWNGSADSSTFVSRTGRTGAGTMRPFPAATSEYSAAALGMLRKAGRRLPSEAVEQRLQFLGVLRAGEAEHEEDTGLLDSQVVGEHRAPGPAVLATSNTPNEQKMNQAV